MRKVNAKYQLSTSVSWFTSACMMSSKKSQSFKESVNEWKRVTCVSLLDFVPVAGELLRDINPFNHV